ncbi:hypothetical protein B0O99DRAFT_636388 [Bisporella sp. PMI_857]|nr:hypothetical protein B0O99DRAFT_636388 [Bisporella sp. PMI_857]
MLPYCPPSDYILELYFSDSHLLFRALCDTSLSSSPLPQSVYIQAAQVTRFHPRSKAFPVHQKSTKSALREYLLGIRKTWKSCTQRVNSRKKKVVTHRGGCRLKWKYGDPQDPASIYNSRVAEHLFYLRRYCIVLRGSLIGYIGMCSLAILEKLMIGRIADVGVALVVCLTTFMKGEILQLACPLDAHLPSISRRRNSAELGEMSPVGVHV